jgi:iron(III) transport system ATP-binding protein
VSGVVLESVSRVYPPRGAEPEVRAMDGLDLRIAEGELLVLLGPSGCGKSTTLRALAGLESPDAGRISFGDRTVFDAGAGVDLPPEKRRIGMVFQSYALWPHRTVRDNIGYPLTTRKELRGHTEWITDAAALVDCAALLDRYPGQLSGGQQQRVALARGIVARPDLVLLDEPLSNLDARLRDQVRGELKALHRAVGFTGVHVTHDQVEALALGDRLAVMRAGRIEQLGTPEEVFARPATDYVADFVGFVDRLDVQRDGGGWRTEAGKLDGPVAAVGLTAEAPGPATLRVRPEDLEVLPDGERVPDALHVDGARVTGRSFLGRSVEVLVEVGGASLRAHVDARVPAAVAPGERATVAVRPDHALAFGPDGVRL